MNRCNAGVMQAVDRCALRLEVLGHEKLFIELHDRAAER